MVPHIPPKEIFDKLLAPYGNEAKFDVMRKVLSIAQQRYNNYERARAIISEVYFVTTEKINLTLNRMLELELIEPIDVGLFTSAYMSISFHATLLLGGEHTLIYSRWRDGRLFLLSTIREKPPLRHYPIGLRQQRRPNHNNPPAKSGDCCCHYQGSSPHNLVRQQGSQRSLTATYQLIVFHNSYNMIKM